MTANPPLTLGQLGGARFKGLYTIEPQPADGKRSCLIFEIRKIVCRCPACRKRFPAEPLAKTILIPLSDWELDELRICLVNQYPRKEGT
jgi:hypothetical protein